MALVNMYKKKVSGPLLDRIDIHLDVLPVAEEKLVQYTPSDSSKTMKSKVLEAKERQQHRFRKLIIQSNSEMKNSDIKTLCIFSESSQIALRNAVSTLNLSARSYFKVIKIAQTIADLEGAHLIDGLHVSEALQYRAIA